MKLFNLNPIGLGTEQAESFFSYMYRLAAAHGVSLNALLQRLKEAETKAADKCNPEATTSGAPWSTLAMVRPTESTLDIVKLINHYTNRDDLQATTFLAMRKLKYRSVSLFDSKLYWCPCCLEDDIQSGKPAYYRLLWSCKEVEDFPIGSCCRCRPSAAARPPPQADRTPHHTTHQSLPPPWGQVATRGLGRIQQCTSTGPHTAAPHQPPSEASERCSAA